ncbi:MAG: hypothetical protein M9891_10005 [Austwickia sp.]|nr:hypothetical protein [Austwickia sp.]
MADERDAISFPQALRAAVRARGLGLQRISAHLRRKGHHVSSATLSYWQSGRSAPSRFTSLAAIGELEVVLGVPRGSLARLATLGAPSAGSPSAADAARPVPPPQLADVVDRGRAVDEILTAWGDTLHRDVTVVSKQTVGWADAHGNTPRIRSREVLVLPQQPIETYVVAGGHPFAGVKVEVSALIGATIRRCVSETENSFAIAQLALPPAPPGGVHVLEYEFTFSGLPAVRRDRGQCVVLALGPVREAYLEVRFPVGAAPESVTAVQTNPGGAHRSPLTVSGQAARLLRRDFGPGTLTLEWTPTGARPG